MKIATFNINNINKRLHNLTSWLAKAQPDVVCLQELKAEQRAFPASALRDLGYRGVWLGERSWNGVAILARERDVLLTLLDDVVRRMRKVLRERVPLEKLDIDRRRLSAKTVQEFCEQRMRQLLDTIFVDEPTIRLVLRDARGLDHVVEKVITEIDGLLLEALEREIRAGQKLGVLGPGDPVFLARHNLGAIEKVVLTALARDPEPLDLDAVVRDTVRVQLFGMLAKEVRR